MQNKEDHIDQLFKSKLGNYEQMPSSAIWDQIAASTTSNRRRKAAFWIFRFSGAAALILAFVAGWQLSDHSLEDAITAAQTNRMNINQRLQNSTSFEQDIILCFEKPLFAPISKSYSEPTEKHPSHASSSIPKPERMDLLTSNRIFVPLPVSYRSQLMTMNRDQFSNRDKRIIEENLMAYHSDKSPKIQNKWSLGIQASPLYRFDQPGIESDEAFYATAHVNEMQLSAGYQPVLSGGLKLAFDAGEKLAIVTGINYSELAQNANNIGVVYSDKSFLNDLAETDNTAVFAAMEANTTDQSGKSTNNVLINTNVGWANLNLPEKSNYSPTRLLTASNLEATQSYELNQKAGYLEVPLIMQYALINKRLGLHLSGGINTNVLISNSIKLSNQNKEATKGKVEGLRPITFSSSFGLGIDYALSKRFILNLDPTLKIQLNSLNAQQNFDARPYVFGIYSGLNYRF